MTLAAPKSPRRGRKKKDPLVLAQAVVRGHQQRKRWKTEMHRTKVVREFLSSEQVRCPSPFICLSLVAHGISSARPTLRSSNVRLESF
jgi:hypothetical protein